MYPICPRIIGLVEEPYGRCVQVLVQQQHSCSPVRIRAHRIHHPSAGVVYVNGSGKLLVIRFVPGEGFVRMAEDKGQIGKVVYAQFRPRTFLGEIWFFRGAVT